MHRLIRVEVGFGIKGRGEKENAVNLHLCMYLLLSVINCIFNIVVNMIYCTLGLISALLFPMYTWFKRLLVYCTSYS